MTDEHPFRPAWQERQGKCGCEHWRPGPDGLALGVWQPHGDGVWRMYWGILPVVRSHSDLGIFSNASSAMEALDGLAANGMRDALFD